MVTESNKDNLEKKFIIMENRLFNIAYGILRNHYDAEDVVYDAYIKASESINQLRDMDKLPYWLCTITRNKALEKYNKKKRELLIECQIYSVELRQYESQTDMEHPEKICVRHDYQRYLKEKISNILDPCSRDIIFAYYFDGLSYKELSYKFNMKEGTIKSRMSRSKAKIRLLLQDILAS